MSKTSLLTDEGFERLKTESKLGENAYVLIGSELGKAWANNDADPRELRFLESEFLEYAKLEKLPQTPFGREFFNSVYECLSEHEHELGAYFQRVFNSDEADFWETPLGQNVEKASSHLCAATGFVVTSLAIFAEFQERTKKAA